LPPSAESEGAARRRVDDLIVMALALFRAGGLFQVAAAVAEGWAGYPNPKAMAALASVVAAESGAFLLAAWRRRGQALPWVAGDALFIAGATATATLLTRSLDQGAWTNFMYPFSLLVALGVGLVVRRLGLVVVLTGLLALAYVVVTPTIHYPPPLLETVLSSLSYFVNAAIAWAVAGELRRSGRALDESRSTAVAQATELAAAREWAREARALHDRVLQTLEILPRGPWLADEVLRRRVAAEAAWLRRRIERGPDAPSDLLGALDQVIDQHVQAGLEVEFNDVALRAQPPPPGWLEGSQLGAVVGAVDEALRNVRQHAGVARATVRVAVEEGGCAITVADRGRGFEASRAGFGTWSPILGALEEAGGRVRIDASPGSGTLVEIWVPSSPARRPAPAAAGLEAVDLVEVPGPGARRASDLIVLALTLCRLGALFELATSMGGAWSHYRYPGGPLFLARPGALLLSRGGLVLLGAVTAVEGAALVLSAWRRRGVPVAWAVADALFVAGAVVAGALSRGISANVIYPFSLLAVVAVGLAVRPLPLVVALAGLPAVANLVAAMTLHQDGLWGSVQNSLSYLINAAAAWAVASELRRSAGALDESRRVAVAQAAELAAAKERAREARALHDRVLQTLEMLPRGPWLAEERLRRRVAAEAAWLRRRIERGPDGPVDLMDALDEVFDRHAEAGLEVDLSDAALRAQPPPAGWLGTAQLEAVAGAVDEALGNVRKHAGVGRATVQLAVVEGGCAITVADRGRGFAAEGSRPGFGTRNSIVARVEEAGGRVRIDSSPGSGTLVEIWVPQRDVHGGPRGAAEISRSRRLHP
jgi:signal transduction histidine kinase